MSAPSGLRAFDGFSGAGGSTYGMRQAGIEVVAAANHWTRAIESHAANHPDTEHWCEDISRIDFRRRLPKVDLLWFSPECFPAGSLVTTARGQVPIEDVAVGDMALTHRGRWRRVVRTQSRRASTVTVKGQGHPHLEVTPNHRFWARASRLTWRNQINQYRRDFDEPDWMPVGGMPAAEALWATPTVVEPLETFDPPEVFGPDLSAAWWMVGYWVGNGSLTFGRNHEVLITCGFHRADEIGERLGATGHRWMPSPKRTAMVFYTGEQKARDWLHHHFGHGAAHKSLPSWTLSLSVDLRRSLLDGYLAADGNVGAFVQANTVSKKLAISVRLLAESLDHRVSFSKDKRATYSIEGRTGTAKPQWLLRWTVEAGNTRFTVTDEQHAWSRVREILPGRDDVEVFNIEVEEDHSYVLDGIVVANCTTWSRGRGKKEADPQGDLFDDDPQPLSDDAVIRSRMTMFDVLRALEALILRSEPPIGGIVENVFDVPRKFMFWNQWLDSFGAAGYDYEIVSLNAAFAADEDRGVVPVAQDRNRMFVVFWRKDLGRRPDLDIRPKAWCPTCERTVHARQSWKKPFQRHPFGEYGANGQYWYRCPDCRGIAAPTAPPVADIIDWSDPGTRIGDRAQLGKRPLVPATMRRIATGAERLRGMPGIPGRPAGMVMAYYGNGSCSPVTRPLPTQPTGERFALVTGIDDDDINEYRYRMMQPRGEIHAAQGFPSDYVLHGTKKEVFAQIGNAVPTNCAHLLGDRFIQCVENERVA